ncbi:hypothetical protein CPBF1521_02060 [Xanthomonas arboricola pv. juglandis]|nr:hypothetical protein CPBF1521_02060 [Xanthomonas arboricola pv. juglandis]
MDAATDDASPPNDVALPITPRRGQVRSYNSRGRLAGERIWRSLPGGRGRRPGRPSAAQPAPPRRSGPGRDKALPTNAATDDASPPNEVASPITPRRGQVRSYNSRGRLAGERIWRSLPGGRGRRPGRPSAAQPAPPRRSGPGRDKALPTNAATDDASPPNEVASPITPRRGQVRSYNSRGRLAGERIWRSLPGGRGRRPGRPSAAQPAPPRRSGPGRDEALPMDAALTMRRHRMRWLYRYRPRRGRVRSYARCGLAG